MQSESNQDPRSTPGNPSEPDQTIKRDDSFKNKIHPEASPPQVILGETAQKEETPLIEPPLSPPDENVRECIFSYES